MGLIAVENPTNKSATVIGLSYHIKVLPLKEEQKIEHI
jgi:hypothetical protein